jgi:glycosyltransferase involved in cell wall biosynthesis
MDVHFLLLTSFISTGGIEKFNRAFMKALEEICSENKFDLIIKSSHDNLPDERYIPKSKFLGFKGHKIKFVIKCLAEANKMELVFIGHINLALVAVLLKLLNPRIKLIVVGHGIEIWERQILFKKFLLKLCIKILAVSNYTKQQIIKNNGIDPNKIIIFHNTIDPFFKYPDRLIKPEYLLKRYNINKNAKIVLTITRINKHEEYKGYDRVIDAMGAVLKAQPKTIYFLGGKYDEIEKVRIEKLIEEKGIKNHIILAGFINEDELTDHYLLGNVFAMPSKKEGFGIVFIEAVACCLPVIAGNKDGSKDALLNGEIGLLVNPDSHLEILDALLLALSENTTDEKCTNRKRMLEHYSFEKFKERTYNVLMEQDTRK